MCSRLGVLLLIRCLSFHFRAGWTCLHYAVYHGHAQLVVDILKFAASKGFLRSLMNRKVIFFLFYCSWR